MLKSPNREFLLWIPVSAADATAVNPSGIKTFLDNVLSTFKVTELSLVDQEVYQFILLILFFMDADSFDNFIFENYFINYYKLFSWSLQSFESCLSVNNHLCGRLVSTLESPIIFDDSFRVTQ